MLKDPKKLSRIRRLDEVEEPPARKLPPARGFFGRLIHGEEIVFSRWRFDGRWVALLLILSALGSGLAFWWAQGRDFYHELQADTVLIAGNTYQVRAFRGVDSSSAPAKLHTCFLIDGQILAPPFAEPVPPAAPRWFKCFKAGFIAREIADGRAKAYLAEYNEKPGYDRIVTVSTGGRAFMWRQPNGLPTE